MGAHKTLLMKKRLAKTQRQNRPLPNWFRYKTDNKIRYNAKRRHWRRTKLKIYWLSSFHYTTLISKHNTPVYHQLYPSHPIHLIPSYSDMHQQPQAIIYFLEQFQQYRDRSNLSNIYSYFLIPQPDIFWDGLDRRVQRKHHIESNKLVGFNQ